MCKNEYVIERFFISALFINYCKMCLLINLHSRQFLTIINESNLKFDLIAKSMKYFNPTSVILLFQRSRNFKFDIDLSRILVKDIIASLSR